MGKVVGKMLPRCTDLMRSHLPFRMNVGFTFRESRYDPISVCRFAMRQSWVVLYCVGRVCEGSELVSLYEVYCGHTHMTHEAIKIKRSAFHHGQLSLGHHKSLRPKPVDTDQITPL